MPELPEVETVARSLAPHLVGQRIIDLLCCQKRVLNNITPTALRTALQKAPIQQVGRRAKLLVLTLGQGSLLIHLRMTGRLYIAERRPADTKYLSALFLLADGGYLIMEDKRRFGRIYWFATGSSRDAFLSRLGPEPLSRRCSGRWLADNLLRRQRQIKPLLLDQSFIAGLGNIYVDEALWLAQIHPLTLSSQIDAPTAQRLCRAIRQILRKSIAVNGATIRDFRFLGERRGGYADQTLVFGRTNQACHRCGQRISKIRVAQRGTHICLNCQPLAR